MLAYPTQERLIALGLTGMVKALEHQRRSPGIAALSFEELLGLRIPMMSAACSGAMSATDSDIMSAVYSD